MSATWSTTVADWQGVDDNPTTGSDNLVKSGGVAGAISKNVDTIVRSCRYRGNITVEGKTVKFGVGWIYLYTTKDDYSIKITEEKVFENIAQDNMFIVVDTANGNEITTRNQGTGSDNRFNKITEIPLLYWDTNVVYGYLANYLISKNVDTISKNVDTISKNVDDTIICKNRKVQLKVGQSATLAYKLPIVNREDEALYVTVLTTSSNRDFYVTIKAYDSNGIVNVEKTLNYSKGVNAIRVPIEETSESYSIYVRPISEDFEVAFSYVTVGNNVYYQNEQLKQNVDTISKNVDASVINKTITVKKDTTITLSYKSVIPSNYIEDDILYITLIADNKDITADFTLYEEDETMTSYYSISLDNTNAIAMPLEGKYKKYSIYIITKSEEQIVTSIEVILGRYSYMISSLDNKTSKTFNVIENNFVSLPSSIKEEIGLTFKRFSSWNAGKDKIVFPAITDIHAGTIFNKIKQLKNLIDNFNQFGFDFYANLGDVGIDVAYTNGGLDASYNLLNYISDVSNTANAPVLFANGNHETMVKELPTRVRKEYLNKPQERKWKGLKYANGGNNGTYFNEEKGLKVIILDNFARADTDNNPPFLAYEGIDKEQLSWFIDELVKAKDTENIIVLEHRFPYYKGNWRRKKEEDGQTIYEDPAANDDFCPSTAFIRNTIIAFNKRQIGTDSVYNDVSYDFSNATGTICGLFSGDSHFDVHHQEEGLLLVCHQSMGDLSLEQQMPSWGIYSEFDKLTNTLIDVVSICPSARQIKIFRVGAGGEERDREFSY